MIDSVSSYSTMVSYASTQSSSSNQSSSSLTSSQLDTISSVLSNYDPENLTSEDAKEIISAFEEAGIKPSQQMEEAMAELGFTASEIGPLAGMQPGGGMGGMSPPPPPPSQEEQDSVSSLLDTLLSTNSTDEESSFDEIMEYTSLILSLNEDSKSEVQDILDKYSSEDNEYSSEETSFLVKSALNDILTNSDNYNNVSFYA